MSANLTEPTTPMPTLTHRSRLEASRLSTSQQSPYTTHAQPPPLQSRKPPVTLTPTLLSSTTTKRHVHHTVRAKVHCLRNQLQPSQHKPFGSFHLLLQGLLASRKDDTGRSLLCAFIDGEAILLVLLFLLCSFCFFVCRSKASIAYTRSTRCNQAHTSEGQREFRKRLQVASVYSSRRLIATLTLGLSPTHRAV